MARPAATAPFTAADDALLLELRGAGLSWCEVGAQLGRGHIACQRRWDETRSQRPKQAAPTPPLPGHPVTWGAIALGCLAGL